jgi:hypothetical protein
LVALTKDVKMYTLVNSAERGFMTIDHESLKIILDQINNNHRDFKMDIREDFKGLRTDLNNGLKKKHEYTDAKIIELKVYFEKELEKQEKEIRDLNKFKWKLSGMSVIVIGLLQFVVEYLKP